MTKEKKFFYTSKKIALFLFAVIFIFVSVFSQSIPALGLEEEQATSASVNGYVTNISFPPYGSDGTAPNLTFMQNKKEYSVVLPDCRFNGLVIEIPESYANSKSLYYTVYVNNQSGTMYKNKKITSKTTNVAMVRSALTTKTCPIGKTSEVKVQVGTSQFEQSVSYIFNVTRSLTLDKISVIPCGGESATIDILKPFENQKDPYRTTYAASTQAEKINLELKATTEGTEIYIGNTLYNPDTEYNLSDYTQTIAGQEQSVIPITLKYPAKDGDSVEVVSEFKLVIGTDNFPKIISQPNEEVRTNKASPVELAIEAIAPNGGTLSYAWYKNGSLISDATASTYQPSVKYAGTNTYKCVVTNTLEGVTYKTESNAIEYTVNKDSLTAPEFTGLQPVQIYGRNTATTLYENSNLNLDVRLIAGNYEGNTEDYIEGVPYQLSVYRGTTDSFDKAELISNTDKYSYQAYGSGGDDYGKYKKYVLHLPAQMVTGDCYYFVKVDVEEDGKHDQAISAPLKITFTPTSEIVLLDGKGTEEAPFLVYSQNDLEHIKSLVEGKDGKTPYNFSGQIVAFANDISLSKDWEPIGNLKEGGDENDRGISLNTFSGTIDGKNHTLTIADHGKPLLKYARKTNVFNMNIQGEHIDSNGLVDTYVVDYGEDGKYIADDVQLRTIDIENVTIKEGTQILKSGFISGVGSGKNAINIRNCTIEKGVIIGYDKKESNIGSFAGNLNGSIENSKSYAAVYGVNAVGGFVGRKGQSMGRCEIKNSAFLGTVEATGNFAGGIIATGYDAGAPGTLVVEVHNCYVAADIQGKEYVGGIIGGDKGHETYNEAGDGYGIKGALAVSDNIFYGKIKSTGKYVGGIIGVLHDFKKDTGEATNFYLDECGAKRGIGGTISGQCVGEEKHNAAATVEEFANKTILQKLNKSATSYKNWIQNDDDKYPAIGEQKVATSLILANDWKKQYVVGESLNLDGLEITVIWSNREKTTVNTTDVEIVGYDPHQYGTQTVTLKFGAATATFDVVVLKPDTPENPKKMTVSFTLLGDGFHDSDADKKIHTLETGGLQTWIPEKNYEVSINATVRDVFEQVLTAAGYTCRNESGNYVQGITRPESSKELAEFTNGPSSGWMYTLNGVHSKWGVAEQYLEPGDKIIFHYTDDFNYEPDTKGWTTPTENVNSVTTDTKTGTTTSPTEVKVSGSTATASVKAENQSEILKQAVENKSAEIVLNVAASDTKGAETVKVQLDTATVKSVVNDTQAALTVKTENGQVSLDREALTAIASEAKGTTITLEVIKVTNPTEVQKKAAGTNGQVLQLTVKSGDKIISDFKQGKATVTVEIPSKLKDKKVAAIYIAEDGQIEQMSGKTVKIDGKDYYIFETPHFSAFALVDAEELGLEVNDEEANIGKIKELVSDMSLKASSSKTSKKNIKVTLTVDKSTAATIKEIKDMGYTVKYKYYRSTKKASKYQAKKTKTTRSFTNTAGKKGTKYYYKARIQVYDKDGKLVAQTALKQCKYAARTWTK